MPCTLTQEDLSKMSGILYNVCLVRRQASSTPALASEQPPQPATSTTISSIMAATTQHHVLQAIEDAVGFQTGAPLTSIDVIEQCKLLGKLIKYVEGECPPGTQQ